MVSENESYDIWIESVAEELERVTKGLTLVDFPRVYHLAYSHGYSVQQVVNEVLSEAGYWEFLKDEKYPQE